MIMIRKDTTLKILGITLILIVFCIHISTADFNAKEYLWSTGPLHAHSATTSESGDDLQVRPFGGTPGIYNGMASGQMVTTGVNGTAMYSGDSSLNSQYSASTTVQYTDGGVVSDSLATLNIQPNESELACTASEVAMSGSVSKSGATPDQQWAVGEMTAMGRSGKYQSDKLSDEKTYALSADFQGRGTFNGHLDFAAESGLSKNCSDINYIAGGHRDFAGTSNLSGGLVGSIDWKFDDFSNVLGANTSPQTLSEQINETPSTNTSEEGNMKFSSEEDSS